MHWDAARALALIDIKNRISVGDRLESDPSLGQSSVHLERMQNLEGAEIRVAPGNGHKVWIALPTELPGAMLARFV
jgi:putative protease